MVSLITAFVFLPCLITVRCDFDVEKDLIFRLYTREQIAVPFALKTSGSPLVSETTFNANRPTRIFIHGFKSKSKVIDHYPEPILSLGDFNFIAVDWTKGAQTNNYFVAKRLIRPIAEKLAELIDHLVKYGLKLEDVTIIGHSLGAHAAGRAATYVKTPGKVAAIIGLDPASVGFSLEKSDHRLTSDDATYVQIIHTDITKFGFEAPIGHADFYPNRGKRQPGCANNKLNIIEHCSHVRAHHFFLSSLTNKFEALHCASFDEIKNNRCTTNSTAIMGGDISASTPKPYGIFYLETNAAAPYNISNSKEFNKIEIINEKVKVIIRKPRRKRPYLDDFDSKYENNLL